MPHCIFLHLLIWLPLLNLQVCEAADNAPWRSQRLTTQELLEREWNRGKRVCPLFSFCGVFNYLFKCDVCTVQIKVLLQTSWGICLHIWWQRKCQGQLKQSGAMLWQTSSRDGMMLIQEWRIDSKSFFQRLMNLKRRRPGLLG